MNVKKRTITEAQRKRKCVNSKRWRLNNPERVKANAKRWWESDLEKHKEDAREYRRIHTKQSHARYISNLEENRLSGRIQYQTNKDWYCFRRRIVRATIKSIVIEEYGGRCTCTEGRKQCRENNPGFLTVHHVNDDGSADRKNGFVSGRLHELVMKLGFPDKYTIRCFNCNTGRSTNGGRCPHANKIKTYKQNGFKITYF